MSLAKAVFLTFAFKNPFFSVKITKKLSVKKIPEALLFNSEVSNSKKGVVGEGTMSFVRGPCTFTHGNCWQVQVHCFSPCNVLKIIFTLISE